MRNKWGPTKEDLIRMGVSEYEWNLCEKSVVPGTAFNETEIDFLKAIEELNEEFPGVKFA